MEKWSKVVFMEDDREVEATVPTQWLDTERKRLRWPLGSASAAEKKLPDNSWSSYKLVKIKFQNDSRSRCDAYNETTSPVSENDSSPEKSRSRKKSKRYQDFQSDFHSESEEASSFTARLPLAPKRKQSNSKVIAIKKSKSAASPRPISSPQPAPSRSSWIPSPPPVPQPSQTPSPPPVPRPSRTPQPAPSKRSRTPSPPPAPSSPSRTASPTPRRQPRSPSPEPSLKKLEQNQKAIMRQLLKLEKQIRGLTAARELAEEGELPYFQASSAAAEFAPDDEERKYVIKKLLKVGGNTLPKGVTNMMEKLMSIKCMAGFNMYGRGESTKLKFSSTPLCKIITDAAVDYFKVSEAEVTGLIQSRIKNAPGRLRGVPVPAAAEN